MTPDRDRDPIGRHLDARAREIHLPRTDVGAIVERAAARTSRRRKVTFGITAVALLGAGSIAVVAAGGGDDRTPVATTPDSVVESPLEWTVVDPTTGLGQARLQSSVVAADGSIYNLSTQPGPANLAADDAFSSRTLYRSTDGAEWEAMALPDDLYASSLAADGNRLYAVGTGPTAGDEIPLRLAASDDGGATWSDSIDLPTLEAVAALGPEIVFGNPTVSAHGGTTLVAVTAHAVIDVEDRLPPGLGTENGYSIGREGVEVYGAPPDCAVGPEVVDRDRAAAAVQADAAGRRGDPMAGGCQEPPVVATLTWDQLDVPPELAAMITPHLYLLTSTGDGGFVEVPAPVTEVGYVSSMVATAEGFTLALQSPPGDAGIDPAATSTSVFTSPDGTTWTRTAELPDFNIAGLGVLHDQAVLTGTKSTGQAVVNLLGPSGVVAAVDPADAAPERNGQSIDFWGAGFGPLGWAMIAYPLEEDGPRTVVHSDPTGTVLSSVPVPAELDGWGNIAGLTVTADAIVVRFTANPDGDPSTVEPQRLLVGTPRG